MKPRLLLSACLSLWIVTTVAQNQQYTSPDLFGKQLPSSVIATESRYSDVKTFSDFATGIESWKKEMIIVTDGNGGYKTYVIYDKWLTSGRHYDSYLELSPNCANAFRYPTPNYNAGDVAATLLTGIFSDLLNVNGRIKVGKKTSFSFY